MPFELKASTQSQEDAYDTVAERKVDHPTGFVGTVANLVKGACGAGVLGTHVAYKKGGAALSAVANILIGIYITYCYYILAYSAKKLYKRTNVPLMSYPDVGEAAFAVFPNAKINKCAKAFRYIIDALVIIDLFGSCVTYQLIIAKTIKQLVEDSSVIQTEATIPGYPNLSIYLLALMVPCACICLIRHLSWLGHLSIVANCTIVFCIGVTIYYAIQNNPHFENLVHVRSLSESFEYAGMIVFSMSCIGVILPAENSMRNPNKYVTALFTSMAITVIMIFTSGFFGYVAYLDKSAAPITINFPLTLIPKILKVLMAFMIYVTHALNFWVPFSLTFYYIERKIINKDRVVLVEYICRALISCAITLIAIVFPNINNIMGFLGCFCLANLIFVIPNMIYLLVIWHRPGLGAFKWRLIQWIFITIVGLTLSIAGSYVNGKELLETSFFATLFKTADSSSSTTSTTTTAGSLI